MTQKELEPYVPNWLTLKEDREDAASEAWLRMFRNNVWHGAYAGFSTHSSAVDIVRNDRVNRRRGNNWASFQGRESKNKFGSFYGVEASPGAHKTDNADADCSWMDTRFCDYEAVMDAKNVLSRLEQREQSAILLITEGYHAKEAAGMMGISLPAFKTMFYRAQKKARILAGIESNMVD